MRKVTFIIVEPTTFEDILPQNLPQYHLFFMILISYVANYTILH